MKMKLLTTTSLRRFPLPMPDGEPAGGGAPAGGAPAGGGTAGKWYDGWAPEVVAHIEASKYPDPQAIAVADMNARKLIGVPHDQLVRRPAQGYEIDAKPYHAALEVLGAPKESKAYIDAGLFRAPEALGAIDDKLQTATADAFKKADLLPWQAKIVMDHFYGSSLAAKTDADAAAAALEKDRADRLDAFKANVGAKFDPMVKAAKSVIAKFDKPLTGDIEQLKAKGYLRVDDKGVLVLDADGKPQPIGEFESWLVDTGAGNDPRMIEMVAKIAERFEPSQLVQDQGRVGDPTGTMTKAQAAEEERKLRADSGFMKQFTTKSDPGHAAAVARINDLLKIQNP